MFKQWLFKQGSGWCASGRNMGRWYGTDYTLCPNCNAPEEDAAHLLHCPDTGRFGLFPSEVNQLTEWMGMSHTDPDLARIL